MFNYAAILKDGDGISMNKKEAARYFKMAADKGQENAILNYATILKDGDGIAMNKQIMIIIKSI